jgi:cation diffusion facilitator CzcD-associated flavoprotein CzcO
LKVFPFDPNPAWSKFYADGDLRRNIQFKTRVVANEWLEEEGKWKIVVEKDGQWRDEYADILVSAQGFLR